MIEDIISRRRTLKPAQMNGRQIPERAVHNLLQMADWAPTHGRTEPWRFIVLNQEQAAHFCARHALLYKEHTAPEKFLEASFEKLLHQSDGASHLFITYMQRGDNPKISEAEELMAVACAVQNILLTATAHGIASFWSTGGLTHHPAMKQMLQLRDTDRLVGLLYLGYTDEPARSGSRRIPLEEKVQWKLPGSL